MSKRLLWALILIGVLVLVLVMQRGSVSVELGFAAFKAIKAIIFFAFAALGVVIGTLLK